MALFVVDAVCAPAAGVGAGSCGGYSGDLTKPSRVLFDRQGIAMTPPASPLPPAAAAPRPAPCPACTCLNYEDVYSDPGAPLSRRTSWGTHILAKLDGQRKLLMEVSASNTGAPAAS
ncbi:uncharacterized protein HaLaN_33149 [Haematococcus lacustris]|uniref:Uncharacterized protein n=1 Tax=Haematococcus lacustris TaxID=44745 RepID=A0A6A0AMD8_HAELA|nr:uncharacterized protein HaLaN_33149 [Haematococcus lacustris]